MSSEYRVNKTTGQVVKDDGTGWKPVASVRNKTTGEILIDEGNGWQPLPGAQRTLQADRGMTMASERANQAMASGQRIAPDDLTQLGRPDFSSAAMARLPAPTMSVADMDAFEAQRAAEKERLRVPDSDFKERSIIALNVPTVGFGPQAAAGAKTLGALAATPFIEDDIIDREGVSGAMSSFLDEARVHQRRAREERPLESFGIEIGGGLFQGKTFIDNFGRRMFPKTNTASNLGRVVGTGTGYGLAYGFGQSESDTLQGALGDAAYGGALGAGFGLGFKAAEPALTAGYRSAKTGAATISDALSDLLGKAGGARDKVAQEVALAAVRRSMERSGMTFDQIMELVKRYEGKPAVLAEVIGQDAVNSLTALTRRPGSTPQKAQDLIEERFYGRPDRMKGDVEDATGIPIGQLDETLDAQLIKRQQAAKPIYDALYKQYSTIKSFGESLKRINRLARTPAMQKHLKLAEEAVRTQAAIRQVPLSKMSKMEYWDLVKRSLDDEINSAVAKGEARTKVGASVAELTQLKSAITDEFDRLTGGAYAAAREAGGEAPRLRAAAAAGQKALQARNPRDVAKTVAATLSQDLPALRAGIVEDLGTRIDKGMTPGRVRVPDVAGKLRAGLGDESANKLINRLDAEATLSETGSRWAPRLNSVTGTVMESGATQMGDDLVNAGFNLATGNKVDFARKVINLIRQRGFSQRQIDAIGDLLLSSPEEGLKRLRMLAPDGAPTNAFAPATGAADGALNSTAQGGTPAANAFAQPAPVRASGLTGLRTDAGNAAVGAGVGALGPADSNEERLRNMAGGALLLGAGGRLSRTVGARNALADTASAGFRGQSRSPNAGRFRFGPTGKAFNPYNAQVQDEIIRTSGGLVDQRNIDDLVSTYMDDLVDSTPQQIVNDLRSDAAMNMQTGGIQMTQRDVEYVAFAELMARQLTPMRKGADDILTAGFSGFPSGPRKPSAPKTNAFAQKPGKLGTRTADAAAIATLGLQGGTAEADTGGVSAELKTANERVNTATKRIETADSELARLREEVLLLERVAAEEPPVPLVPTAEGKRVQRILAARNFDLGPNGVDGRVGNDTRKALAGNIAAIKSDIAKTEAERESALKEAVDARNAEKQAQYLQMQRDAEPSSSQGLLVGGAALGAAIAGAMLAKGGRFRNVNFGRYGSQIKSAAKAAATTRKVNKLINTGKITSAQSGANSINQRAANVNTIAQIGGAGRRVPFEETATGVLQERSRKNIFGSTIRPMETSELFKPQRFNANDAYAFGVAGLDVAITEGGIRHLKSEIKAAEAEMERAKNADDRQAFYAALKEKQSNEGLLVFAQIAQKVGMGYIGGRAISGIKPYSAPTPDLAGIRAERTLILQAINKPPPKPRKPAGTATTP